MLVDFSPLEQLDQQYAALKAQAFRPGTTLNHQCQARLYTQFCEHYGFIAVNPAVSTLTYYITHLAGRFKSSTSVRNYVSGINTMHKQVGLQVPALQSFPVTTLLRAVDLSLRTPPHRRLPITPSLLHKLCKLCDCIGQFGVVLKVALTFGYFGMLRQSNLAPRRASQFDKSRHTCRGDIILAPPGVIVVVKWSKAQQTVDNIPLVPLPRVPRAQTDPVAAYHQLTALHPTGHPDQPLLTLPGKRGYVVVTTAQLAWALRQLIMALQLDPKDYSLHSLRRGGATTAYRAGVDELSVKKHGHWRSDAFWSYITTPLVVSSPVPRALAAAASSVATQS